MPEDDPQVPFWDAIEHDPSAKGPRLVFADWCDEQGLSALAEAQRWLAATGHRPRTRFQLPAGKAEKLFGWYGAHAGQKGPEFLQPDLMQHVFGGDPEYSMGHFRQIYRSRRAAEEALAVAWAAATRPSHVWEFWRQPWVPDYEPVAESPEARP